jgi:hypothetical protein
LEFGTLNPQDGTLAPSSSVDQLIAAVSTIFAACAVPRAALSRASGFVHWIQAASAGTSWQGEIDPLRNFAEEASCTTPEPQLFSYPMTSSAWANCVTGGALS